MRGRRGVVLLQVLILAIVIGYISALLLRLTLQPAMTTALVVDGVGQRLTASAAYNKAQAAWQVGGVCGSAPGLGVVCTGSAGTCGCDCSMPGPASLHAELDGGTCRVSVVVP